MMNRNLMMTLLLSCGLSLSYAAKTPNVLFIMSDDLNTALSGYGHPDCKTPNLDRLAERGVQFNNMHCQFPLCGPSRNSIMTGLYPYKNNALTNQAHLREKMPDVVTLPQLFRNNGYQVDRVSKMFHMGIPKEIYAGTSVYDDAASWDNAINIKCKDNPGPKIDWSPGSKGNQGFVATYGTEGDSSYVDGMAADRAIELLNSFGADKPFFLGVGFVRPHVPLIAPQKYYDLYERSALTPPFAPEDDLDDLPKIIQNDQTKKAYGVTTLEIHQGLLEAYYASISYMDAQVGKLLDTLDAKGLTDNTIIVFTSDHGYHIGEHNKFQKRHLFEETTRVPFIISVPWMNSQHGGKTVKITELIDLYPTLAELAGLQAPDGLQGTSLLPILGNISSNDWKKQEAFTVAEKGGETLRTADWRYTQWGFGKSGSELYDLNADPGEFTNLTNNPEYAASLAMMKSKLEEKRLQAGYQGAVTQEHCIKVKPASRQKKNKAGKEK
ncbi:sulfatase [Pontiella sulfatireligans]|uniref:Choline-sulfatase n=1 Tax=Pontiella sulfatireligans TaxID=2750658 RepID=A0A6C2UH65_9BACT|nr:sulfatase [Pontiella sulfatireligans]SPS74184.1 sulfatase S1_7 [Kiritimatiellales bacterium]VGO18546.1 Choline-sulfatase [Pontiella sulfatireligans]